MDDRFTIDDVLQGTADAGRAYAQDPALVGAYSAARRSDASLPDAPLVPNLRLAAAYDALTSEQLGEVASANGALIYKQALETAAMRSKAEVLAFENRKLSLESVTDHLTGLSNRRSLDQRSDALVSRALREGSNVYVMMLDIDRFKSVNDMYGHEAGDRVLQWFATQLASEVRDFDVVGRYGGEEFGIVMSDVDARNALTIAERIRSRIETQSSGVVDPSDPNRNLTVSIGFANYEPDPDPTARPKGASALRESLFNTADLRLYAAKETGRNRIVDYDPTTGRG